MTGTQKKITHRLAWSVSLALLLLCGAGCGQLSEAEESPDTSSVQTVQEEEPLQEDPTPEEIVSALEEASDFAYGWFWDNIHVDHNDTIYEDAVMDGSWPCERVIAAGVSSKEDVLELTKAYFTEETAQMLLNYKEWIERDGALYVSATEGLGDGGMGDSIEIAVQRDSDTQYTLTIRELLNGEEDPMISQPYAVHYQYDESAERWVFDGVVLVYDRPITLCEEISCF